MMFLHTNILGRNFKYAILRDMHEGNLASVGWAIDEAVKMLKLDRVYYSTNGDAIEGKSIEHPHYDPDIHGGRWAMTTAQCNNIASRFYDIRKRCVSWGIGNHEIDKSIRKIINPGKAIVDKMNIEVPVAMTCKLKLAEHFIAYVTHGNIIVNSMAGSKRQIEVNDGERMKRKLMKLPGVDDCHLVACGHGHKLIHVPRVSGKHIIGMESLHSVEHERFVQGEIVHDDDREYVMTGSFLKSVEAQVWEPGKDDIITYTERRGYSRTSIGFILCTIKNGMLSNVEKVVIS